jgi:hypothetical protein
MLLRKMRDIKTNMLKLMKRIGVWLLKYSDCYVVTIALICLYAIFQIKFDLETGGRVPVSVQLMVHG